MITALPARVSAPGQTIMRKRAIHDNVHRSGLDRQAGRRGRGAAAEATEHLQRPAPGAQARALERRRAELHRCARDDRSAGSNWSAATPTRSPNGSPRWVSRHRAPRARSSRTAPGTTTPSVVTQPRPIWRPWIWSTTESLRTSARPSTGSRSSTWCRRTSSSTTPASWRSSSGSCAHLENSGGRLAHEGSSTERDAAGSARTAK